MWYSIYKMQLNPFVSYSFFNIQFHGSSSYSSWNENASNFLYISEIHADVITFYVTKNMSHVLFHMPRKTLLSSLREASVLIHDSMLVLMTVLLFILKGRWWIKSMSYTARPPFTGGMSNQNQQQQQSGQSNNANLGAGGIPNMANMPLMNNAAASKIH